MTTILHISDPHFGCERSQVVQALEKLVSELSPDLLVLSGDITQRARREQFSAAAAFVQRLKVPHALVIPGNHDIPLFNLPLRAFAPYAGYQRAFGAELEPSWSAADCLVLGLNTTRRYRHVDGEISSEQLARVTRELRKASATQLRIVVLHHPAAVPRHSEEHNLVHGHTEAIASFAEAGADLILAGHIHLPFVLPLHEGTNLPRPLWAVNAGTSVSKRVRRDAGNSVNVIRTVDNPSAGRFRVEHWNYSDLNSCFLSSAELSIG